MPYQEILLDLYKLILSALLGNTTRALRRNPYCLINNTIEPLRMDHSPLSRNIVGPL